MGTYVYTLRSNTQRIEGVEIAQYKYAWKVDSWPEAKIVQLRDNMLTMAERALEKNKGITLATMGDWKPEYGAIPVFEGPLMHSFYDGAAPGKQVGYVAKVGSRWKFTRGPMPPRNDGRPF